MPANVKRSDNLKKHLTKAERQARQQAEEAILPNRSAQLKPPRSLRKDPTARLYWNTILKRMKDLTILDDLDTEMLAVYCTALSRRDALNALCRELVAQMEKEPEAEIRLELTNKLDGLMAKLQGHEKTLLIFADKLGMTPESRVRLARKRAAQAAEPDPDDDLFGD